MPIRITVLFCCLALSTGEILWMQISYMVLYNHYFRSCKHIMGVNVSVIACWCDYVLCHLPRWPHIVSVVPFLPQRARCVHCCCWRRCLILICSGYMASHYGSPSPMHIMRGALAFVSKEHDKSFETIRALPRASATRPPCFTPPLPHHTSLSVALRPTSDATNTPPFVPVHTCVCIYRPLFFNFVIHSVAYDAYVFVCVFVSLCPSHTRTHGRVALAFWRCCWCC